MQAQRLHPPARASNMWAYACVCLATAGACVWAYACVCLVTLSGCFRLYMCSSRPSQVNISDTVSSKKLEAASEKMGQDLEAASKKLASATEAVTKKIERREACQESTLEGMVKDLKTSMDTLTNVIQTELRKSWCACGDAVHRCLRQGRQQHACVSCVCTCSPLT